MPSSILSFKKQGKFSSWLSSKLALSKRKADGTIKAASELSDPGGCSPLIENMVDANNQRTTHMLLHKSNVVQLDDCSQQIMSSDQASAIARIDEQSINSYASEHYGSECSMTDSVLAATSHMATIRSLLVSHISETHDTSNIQKKLSTGPAATTMASIIRRSLATSAASAAGHRSSKDRTVQALLADQMQLLDLVQTLIADHRTSLLEQQRLQQQVVAAETALHKVQLDKERAVALAEVRAEQVSHVQADLAVASAAVQKLHSVKTISSQRIRLPPSAEGTAALTSPMSERSGLVSPAQLTPSKRASAIIGRIAPESSWQDQHAIVGPAPPSCKHQPLASGAMAIGPVAQSNGDKRLRTADSRGSSARQIAGASGSRGSSGRLSNSHRATRTITTATETEMPTAAASRTQHSSRQRRLLTEPNRVSAWNSSQQEAAGRKSNVRLQRSSRGVAQQQEVPGDAGGGIRQSHQEAVIAAAAQHAATLAAAPSAASKLAQVHASALEHVLLQRLHSSSRDNIATGQQQQQLQRASVETDGSALSMAWAAGDTDAVAAAAGLTKQQLKQLLHRPWLLRVSQEEVASVLQQQPGHLAAAAASPMRSSQRQQSHQTEYFGAAATVDSESMQTAGQDSDGSSMTTGVDTQQSHDSSSDADDGGSMNEQEQQEAAAAVAAGWKANAQAPWSRQQLQQHSRAGGSGSSEAGMHASNGSSWPAVKMPDMAVGADVAPSAVQRPVANPSHYQRAAARVRPNQQPVPMSASLESAATLPVAMPQGSNSHGSQSSCMTGGGSACGGHGCRDRVYEAAAEATPIPLRQQQQQQQQQRSQVDMSCDLVQQASMESLGSAMCRRKLHLPAAAITEGDQQQQQQQERLQRRISSAGSQQQQQLSPRRSGASITKAGQSPRPAYGADSEDGEVSTTSDFACASIASVATGCSGFSNIDFVPKSHTKDRPVGVPKLMLPVTAYGSSAAVQQQQQVLPSPRERARLIAQQSDMAPLKAQRGTPRGSTAAAASKAAAAAVAGVERAGGSFTAMGSGVNHVRTTAGGALSALGTRPHSFTAGSSSTAAAAALRAEAESSSATVASSIGSGTSKVAAAKAAAVGATISRVSSAGTAATAAGAAAAGVPYWGSSAGSYPVSEEHSRLPTPGSEPSGMQIYAPAAAAALPDAAAAEPYTATTTNDAPAAAADPTVHQQRHQPAQLPLHLQATVAAAAAGELAAAAAGLATAATQAVAGLTPRTAAGTFMGSRPPNVYKSVSTQFAMYSPLRGNLHVLGQTRQGSPGAAAAVDVDDGDSSAVAGCGTVAVAGFGAPAAAAAAGHPGPIYREVSNAASERHYQHLLGTVPEDEGIVYDSLTAAGNADLAAVAAEGVSLHIAAEPSGESSAASLHITESRSSSYTASPSPELVYATSLPTLEDFQRMVLLEQQQRELEQQQREERQQQQQHRDLQQQQQLELEQQQQGQQQRQQRRELQQQQSLKHEMSLDVVDRGPVYHPGVTSPEAAAEVASSIARPVRGSGISSNQQNGVSLQQSRSGATAAAATAVTADEQQQQQQQFGGVGPLTASSPTRKRSSAVLSSSNAGISGSSALSSQQQQDSRNGTEPRYTASTTSSRARTSTDTAAVARLEAAAAAVQARVAAVASRGSSRRPQQQQQQQEGVEVLISHAAVSHNVTLADAEQQQQQQHIEIAVVNSSSSGGNRVRRRWTQQQEDAASASSGEQNLSPCAAAAAVACASCHRSEAAAAQPPKRQHTCCNRSRTGSRSLQQQQQPGCELKQQQQLGKRGSSKGSSRTSSGAGYQPAVPHSAAAAAASIQLIGSIGLPDYRDDMVTSYHNPMLMLEGLDEEGEQAMINAGLVPGLTPQGLAAGASWAGYNNSALATQSSADLLPAASKSQASFDNYQGVDAAAVPAHVTPLGKERSAAAVGQGAGAAADQNGGQLHWNPLYDPNAWNGSPVLGY